MFFFFKFWIFQKAIPISPIGSKPSAALFSRRPSWWRFLESEESQGRRLHECTVEFKASTDRASTRKRPSSGSCSKPWCPRKKGQKTPLWTLRCRSNEVLIFLEYVGSPANDVFSPLNMSVLSFSWSVLISEHVCVCVYSVCVGFFFFEN